MKYKTITLICSTKVSFAIEENGTEFSQILWYVMNAQNREYVEGKNTIPDSEIWNSI
jgi:hypothetical protein